MNNIIESQNVFELDSYLAKGIKWSNYTLVEIKTIAGIYSTINPEWSDIKDIVFDAKYYRDLLNIDRNTSISEIKEIFKSIKSKVNEIWVEPTYNLTEQEIILMELDKSKDIIKENEKSMFPKELKLLSLIGSVSIKVDQKSPDYEVRAQKISIGFDEHIKRHLLFSKNVLKDDEGNIISGMNQYFSCPLSQIKSFKSVYALRMFLALFSYNGIVKKFTFTSLCDAIGIDIKKELDSTKLKRKYYNFKSRTLNNIIKEINACTDMNLTFTDEILVKKDGTVEINVFFDIPNYRKESKIEEVKKKVSNSKDKYNDKDDNNNSNNNGNSENGENNTSNNIELNENMEKDSNESENSYSADDYDWGNLLDNLFPDKSDSLTDDDRKFIDMNVNLLKSTGNTLEYNVIKDIYLENNKDKIVTTKKLMELIKK